MIIVLGESPARGYEGAEPIVGLVQGRMCQTGRRWCQLCEAAGLSYRDFVYLNASNTPSLSGARGVIALGETAKDYVSFYIAKDYLTLPHPSGRSTAWNTPEQRQAYADMVRRFVRDCGLDIENAI